MIEHVSFTFHDRTFRDNTQQDSVQARYIKHLVAQLKSLVQPFDNALDVAASRVDWGLGSGFCLLEGSWHVGEFLYVRARAATTSDLIGVGCANAS